MKTTLKNYIVIQLYKFETTYKVVECAGKVLTDGSKNKGKLGFH